MKQLYKEIRRKFRLYLPLKENNLFCNPCMYASNYNNMIEILAFDPKYDLIIYRDDQNISNKTNKKYMFIKDFINNKYIIINNKNRYFKKLDIFYKRELPF